MNRRTFFIEAGKTFPVVAGAIYLLSCDGDSDGSDGSMNGNEMVIVAQSTVSAGHTHTAEVPLSDLESTVAIDYTSSFSGGHTHRVTLTDNDFAALRAGGEVTVRSTTSSGHSHDFTFRS